MKTLLSLFDHTGNWSRPFEDAGHNVLQADIKNECPVDIAALDCSAYFDGLEIEDVDGILAAPPCTTFTKAAAHAWPKQDAAGQTEAAVHLALQVIRSVELFKPDFWALENPVGRLPRLLPLLGRPRLIFHPYEYAGYSTTMDERERLEELRGYYARGRAFSKADIALIKRTGAYTKQTCLWGDFNLPERNIIEPVRVCAQGSWLQRLGGKSEKTKAARSETPLGFAWAFFEANNWNPHNERRFAAKRQAAYAFEITGGAQYAPGGTCLEREAILRLVREEYGNDIDSGEVMAAYILLEASTH